MKKNFSTYDDEIDLVVLFKTIWSNKIKILSIIIISFLIGILYSFLIPNNYLYSLTINASDNSEFEKLESINQSVNFEFTKGIDNKINQTVLNKFFKEISDYEEYLIDLKNKIKNSDNKSKSLVKIQEKGSHEIKKLLNFILNDDLKLELKWDNFDEAKDILQDTINLTLNNLVASTYKEFDLIIEKQKKLIRMEDLARIEYLKEQSWIAKELNIADNQITTLFLNEANNLIYNPYYLMGYKAIDKEIELIQNREYKNFKSIKQELNFLKNEKINFIDYDLNLIKVKRLKNIQLILVISILLGLILGIFYVLITNEFQSKISDKK